MRMRGSAAAVTLTVSLMVLLVMLCGPSLLLAQTEGAKAGPRARDLGIPFDGTPGR